jgi:hypothetical protein
LKPRLNGLALLRSLRHEVRLRGLTDHAPGPSNSVTISL